MTKGAFVYLNKQIIKKLIGRNAVLECAFLWLTVDARVPATCLYRYALLLYLPCPCRQVAAPKN